MLTGVEASAPNAEARPGPVPRSLWERIKADPGRAPEHIALAAGDRFAGPAERWARRARHRHGQAEIARIAGRRHVRIAQLEGGIAGLGGGFTVPADLAALAWIQGRMTFFIAAAFGFDPRDPMRPAELLMLQELYETPAEARAALDGIGTSIAVQYVVSQGNREEALTRRLLKMVGRTLAKRAVYRVMPILSAPVSAAQNGRVTSRLAHRAIAYYGDQTVRALAPE